MPCIFNMCVLRYEATTIKLHLVQLTLVFLSSLKVVPSPVARHLYAVSTHSPQMNLDVHTTVLVLLRLSSSPILRNIATVTVSASYTHP